MFKKSLFVLIALLLAPAAIAELHDPTLPGNLPAVQSPVLSTNGEIKLNLTAIRISSKTKQAIINGALVNVGDTLPDGAHILKIYLHHVLIRQNGVKKQLYLVPFVKHPVK